MKTTNSICIMIPEMGGGTPRHAREMAEAWSHETTVIYIQYCGRVYNIALMYKGKVTQQTVLFAEGRLDALSDMLIQYQVKLIHIHHFLYMSDELMDFFRKLTIPYMVTLHDYYTICPRVQLLSDGKFCGVSDEVFCNKCIHNGEKFMHGIFPYNIVDDIKKWRSYWFNFLNEAECLFCPSDDQRNRMLQVFPQLTAKLYMVENPEVIAPEFIPVPCSEQQRYSEGLRIGVIGSISKIKGRDVILACAELAKKNASPIKFVVFGTLNGVHTRHIPNNVEVLGRYREQDVYQLIADNHIDFSGFLRLGQRPTVMC